MPCASRPIPARWRARHRHRPAGQRDQRHQYRPGHRRPERPTNDASIIHTDGQLQSADAFRKQIIAYQNGAPVRIGDVANVVDSSNDMRSGSWVQRPARHRACRSTASPAPTPSQVVDNIKKVLPQFQAILPPSIKLKVLYDRSQTIRASVDDVQNTLLIAAVLVVLVIFVFLRKVSATIIPSLALPIAVIGTFAGMSLLGYNSTICR